MGFYTCNFHISMTFLKIIVVFTALYSAPGLCLHAYSSRIGIGASGAPRSRALGLRRLATRAASGSDGNSEQPSADPSMPSFRPVDYDKAISTFAPSGELLQVRYAQKAAERGAACVVMALSSGDIVVCMPSPPMDALLDRNNSEDKLWSINRLSFAAFSGLAGDGLALVRGARRYASAFESTYECASSPRALAVRIGEQQHEATLKGGAPLIISYPYYFFI